MKVTARPIGKNRSASPRSLLSLSPHTDLAITNGKPHGHGSLPIDEVASSDVFL